MKKYILILFLGLLLVSCKTKNNTLAIEETTYGVFLGASP